MAGAPESCASSTASFRRETSGTVSSRWPAWRRECWRRFRTGLTGGPGRRGGGERDALGAGALHHRPPVAVGVAGRGGGGGGGPGGGFFFVNGEARGGGAGGRGGPPPPRPPGPPRLPPPYLRLRR